MVSPMRIQSGVSTADKYSALWNFPMPDPTKFFVYFDDFGNGYDSTNDYTATAINASTAALTTTSGGAILLTTDTAENDGIQLQAIGSPFLPVSGKKLWIKTRFKLSDATQSDFLIGIAAVDTTLLGSTGGDGVTDGIFFAKDDGSAAPYVSVQKNTTTGQLQGTSIATLSNDTYVTLGLEYDGISSVKYFVDGVQKGTLDLTSTPSTYLPDAQCTASIALLSGSAGAKTMTMDYIFAAIER